MATIYFEVVLVCSLAAFCSVAPAYGRQVWEKKAYAEWSMSEVTRVLDDSPWAQTQIEHGQETFTVTIRLRSALPIRQALIRERQLQLNYEKLAPAQRTRFDADAKTFLECAECANYYIVTLHSAFNQVSPLRVINNLSLEKLKPHVWLANDRGERRNLVGFRPPKGEGRETVLIFQRFDDRGRPLITVENRQLYFKIEEKVFEGKTLIPVKKFTFEVPKLIRDGEVQF
jgi:hypothetical protein